MSKNRRVGIFHWPVHWSLMRSLVGEYRLTVLFGLAALVFVVMAALVIGYAVGRIAESNLIRIAEKSITADALDMLSMIQQPSQPLTLEALAGPDGLPRQLPTLVQKYSIVKINLINPEGMLVWSTDRRSIGASLAVSRASARALEGSIASSFWPNEELAELGGRRPRLSVVSTSLPLRESGAGQIIGVLEVHRNVTDDVPFLIGATRSAVLHLTAATMFGLFVVLLTVVVLADVAIGRSKRREKIILENQLAERRHAAAALLESNSRLEEVVEELKKTQEQILRQERLRALGEMASGIAHDFNNALTPILGYSSLLLDHPERLRHPEAVKGQLSVINTAAQDAAAVVARLKEFYRGRDQTDRLETLDLNDLATQAISLTQAKWKDQSQARGITINVETRLTDLPPVLGNATEIREALMNLLLNAVDAMPRGGTITLESWTEAGHAMLKVTDTGTGMTEEVRQRCLDPFFTTKGSHGTGMGLAMVYGIIQRHDGKMDISTQPGRGTSFILRFPQPAQSPQPAIGPEPGADPVSRLRVLVVDDEPLVLELLREYLTIDGHTVVTAAGGSEGLARFEEGPCDLVLTDRAMPGMSGDGLAAAIKERSPGTPVILITGFGAIMAATGDNPEAVDLVLGKPVGMTELRRAIAQAMAPGKPAGPNLEEASTADRPSALVSAAI